jgi:hypothetical protein
LAACPRCSSYLTKEDDRGLGCALLFICGPGLVLSIIGGVELIQFFAPFRVQGAPPVNTHEVSALLIGIASLIPVIAACIFAFGIRMNADRLVCKECGHKWDQSGTDAKPPIGGMPF